MIHTNTSNHRNWLACIEEATPYSPPEDHTRPDYGYLALKLTDNHRLAHTRGQTQEVILDENGVCHDLWRAFPDETFGRNDEVARLVSGRLVWCILNRSGDVVTFFAFDPERDT